MTKQTFLSFIILCGITVAVGAQTAAYRLENSFLVRTLEVNNGVLATQSVYNKLSGKTLTPLSCEEFALRISDGTDKEGTDRILTAKDFIVLSVSDYHLTSNKKGRGYRFMLNNKKEKLSVTVSYELADDDSFCHKYLQIRSGKEVTLERVDVESISFADAWQNYVTKEITAQGSARWKPGLGQPLYTTETATYWGIEFPAATNLVTDKKMSCGYLRGFGLSKDEEYTTYKSVVGVADDPAYLDDAFYAYINKIRKRPLRLQIQYNSWFDFGKSVSGRTFATSVRKVNNELVLERGCTPLNAYVIDDGWQHADPATADWSGKVWTVNSKFSSDFSESRQVVKEANSNLGLWLSPASILGGLKMVPKMREYGYESLSYGMSMTGAVYMQKLEDRVVELASGGVSYFKFDGLFGHLNIRDFELQGRGTAAMPQLGLEGFSSNDERLNDSRYDELKLYYLTAGTERLMKIFNRLGEVNPDIFIAITNGAYLSPWWLQYVDVVWLINAGDAAKGNNRNGELVYRDNVYHQIWKEENTKFPMNSVFNHEPKKTGPDETPEAFRDYLYMNLSRGTGFIELYIKTEKLSYSDWDILADGLKWAQKVFPLFHNVRMHGGSPRDNEVYGYSAWNKTQGYLSFHNPSEKEQTYNVMLDRSLGLLPETDMVYHVSSPLGSVGSRVKASYRYGDMLSLTLKPGEITVLDFTNLASSFSSLGNEGISSICD